MKTVTQTENEVLAVLHRFMETYAKRDEQGMMELFAPDPDVVLIGTGVDEKRSAPARSWPRRIGDWTQSEYAFFELIDYSISGAGPVVWLSCEMDRQRPDRR